MMYHQIQKETVISFLNKLNNVLLFNSIPENNAEEPNADPFASLIYFFLYSEVEQKESYREYAFA